MNENKPHNADAIDDKEARYKARMQRKKAVIDESIARADQDKGVCLVLTGNGKGKSSSGFGMVARALGHGMQVGVVQFIKGSYSTGEEAFFRRFDEVEYYVMGEGFTWETQDKTRDIEAASAAWAQAKALLENDAISLVVLDELNIALKYKYVALDDVITAVQSRPRYQHVVITGRGAPQALIDVADTVTEMQVIKHAYQAGIKAQKGVEL
ncbi:cob(I)yrinic acid a,c-diamide adenosyltransferase [Neptunomonas phycophila]|uniref:cob(I)yrinic acid a,c-diamide adenosyltransferase n=1 Tax=Neptunomonas TaxID=75687 RepID=UPI0015BFA4D9|nr:cob(I)yrinic acid a,c-diamide adenosyltransferase [Neptunomonas phycophila]MDO6466936.1 cob(I)yrinic acid a,c-diamide adenosyltransferase [Neptunomonas phycophila]QLE97752.1 cob(I)yrinic acid a,c-diamide adenosyltransferase [Neptunomonas phycophila]